MNHPPRLSRRHVLAMGAGLALSAPLLPALAQSFPTRPLRLVVNFAQAAHRTSWRVRWGSKFLNRWGSRWWSRTAPAAAA